MKFLFPCAFILLVVFPSFFAFSQPRLKKVEIMVEDAAAPWSHSNGEGIANDIVVAVFKEMKVEMNLKVVPYGRCKAAAMNGKTVACFSMAWLPEFKGRIILAKDPLIYLNSDVFENVKKPLPKPPKGRCQLPAGIKAGVVNEYEYPPETMRLLDQGVQFVETRSDSQNLQMLSLSRVDASIVITNNVEPRNRKAIEAGVEQSVRLAFNCGQETGTIGFSLLHPDGLKAYQIYEEGYDRIQKKGVIKKIYQKWVPIKMN